MLNDEFEDPMNAVKAAMAIAVLGVGIA